MMATEEQIRDAVGILKRGGIVIYPTDTAFGIGCRIDDKPAVDRLFALRRRSRQQATPVLVDGAEMALAYYDSPPQIVRRFMNDYWPGALTIIARCKTELLYSPIRGDGDTVGLRMPNHPTALALIRGTGVPLIGTSANFHGEATPFAERDLDPELTKLVDMVVLDSTGASQGKPGEHSMKLVSTVVDCSVTPYHIVRQGAVILPETI